MKKKYAQPSTLGHIMLLQTPATLIHMSVAHKPKYVLFPDLCNYICTVQTKQN